MGKEILIINGNGKNIDDNILKQINIMELNLSLSENMIEQLKLLKKFSEAGLYIYVILYSFYQNDVGKICIPYWYDGRLIVSKKLGSSVIEFKYDERLLNEASKNFIESLIWTSKIFVSTMDSQSMQEYYYEFSEEKLKKYLEHIICAIDIDHDGSSMKFFYDEKMKINKKDMKEFILEGMQDYKILDE